MYLASSYYERWLAALETGLIDAGTLTADEIEARAGQFAANPDTALPRRDDPAVAERIAATLRSNPATRPIRRQPRFAVGDPVVTRNLNPHGHTRLPRYARGKRGRDRASPWRARLPRQQRSWPGENPQHLYSVRISARELWGGAAEPNESILIDLWESYLEKDAAPSKSGKRKSR